jgi:hypothetical protein
MLPVIQAWLRELEVAYVSMQLAKLPPKVLAVGDTLQGRQAARALLWLEAVLLHWCSRRLSVAGWGAVQLL